jgi:hypothetical protein
MTMTDVSTTTEVPDWLNLDAIVPVETRERIQMLAEHLEAQLEPGGRPEAHAGVVRRGLHAVPRRDGREATRRHVRGRLPKRQGSRA